VSAARAWVLAARPGTLAAAVSPILVGSACAAAAGAFRPGPALAALFGAVLIQIGTNLANDLYDFKKGADTAERLGPPRVTQTGLLTPEKVRAGAIVAFALAALAGLYLLSVAGWPVVVIGLLSIVSGVAYTAGPRPLGYVGLGDLFVFVFFGLVAVCGTAFVQALRVPSLAWIAAVPVGALATAILVVNNLRDRVEDARAGKRTLAVRLGARGARLEYAVLLGLAYAATLAVAAIERSAWGLLPLATAPAAGLLLRAVQSLDGAALNPYLGRTALLGLAHGALLAAGILVGSR
jgi:1,4-dihydroxy-2-naphthoate polyprenyltransferase